MPVMFMIAAASTVSFAPAARPLLKEKLLLPDILDLVAKLHLHEGRRDLHRTVLSKCDLFHNIFRCPADVLLLRHMNRFL